LIFAALEERNVCDIRHGLDVPSYLDLYVVSDSRLDLHRGVQRAEVGISRAMAKTSSFNFVATQFLLLFLDRWKMDGRFDDAPFSATCSTQKGAKHATTA
jgi:hypothetical protein